MKTYTRCIFCKLISLMFVFHVELPCASLGCLCQAGTQSVMHARVALVVVTRVKPDALDSSLLCISSTSITSLCILVGNLGENFNPPL